MKPDQIYRLAIFLCAFLLFLIQPLIGKFLLPIFGGSSGVWSVSLMFFMAALLVGYVYAHLLSRLSKKRQFVIHTCLLLAGLFVATKTFSIWQNGLGDPHDFSGTPELRLLVLLISTIGLPYLILTTTSPLLQNWYARIQTAKNPYKLYALSNLASFLAIIIYPLLVEPFFVVQTQGTLWISAFVAALILLFLCLYLFVKLAGTGEAAPHEGHIAPKISWVRASVWVGLAFIPSMFLLALTNEITQAIAPVPFLWLVPLGLYLLSFVMAFSFELEENFLTGLSAFLIVGVVIFVWGQLSNLSLFSFVPLYLAVFFLCGLICHGFLYRLRPAPRQLTFFYILISFGGALGGIFVSLLAPVIFNDFFENPLALFLSFSMALFLIGHGIKKFFFPKFAILTVVILVTVFVFHFAIAQKSTTWSSRNFYGVLKIVRSHYGEDLFLDSLYNGNILHGSQFSADGFLHFEPTTYYTKSSGVGLLFDALRKSYDKGGKTEGLRVGVIGLGVGTVAAYCLENDYFRFYEINPEVVQVAKEKFGYLKNCKGKLDVAEGDARLVLEAERETGQTQNFDILVLDAFTDDSIPVHLLSKEAVEIYLDHLRPRKGVIAVHISNRYLDLRPVLLSHAEANSLTSLTISSNTTQPDGKAAIWVLLSSNENLLGSESLQSAASENSNSKKIRIWTDSYSNILPLLRF